MWPPAGGGLCRRVVKKKVLRIDRPAAGGFLSLTAFQAEGCDIVLRAMSIKSALRDVLFCVIWHDKHSADWLAALASPFPASPDFPLCRGQNKTPRNTLFINGSTVSTGYCAPACGGKVVAPSHQRGNAFPRPQGGCMVFAAKGGIKNGARKGAVPRQRSGTSYLPRAEPSTRL